MRNELKFENWSEIAPSFVRIPVKLFQYRKYISWGIKYILTKFNKGYTGVLILGRPNVGKSVLLSHLKSDFYKNTWEKPDQSYKIETAVIPMGNKVKIFRNLPGQSGNDKYVGLHRAFRSKYLEGIIYVTDFGFTDIRDNILKKEIELDSDSNTIDKRITNNLKDELKDINKLMIRIGELKANGIGPNWLLIAVNKVDLYYDKIDEAMRYYDVRFDSLFSQCLKEELAKFGEFNLDIRIVPISVLDDEFKWGQTVVKSKLAISLQRNLMKYLLYTIHNLVNQ